MDKNTEKQIVLGNLVAAVDMLQKCPEFASFIPEVRVNLAYALDNAASPDEVAAIDGRITAVNGLPHASGMPVFGASDHMARLIIEVRKYDPAINAGINFKCDDSIIEIVKAYCAERGLLFGWIDRREEPSHIIGHNRSSMPWKIAQLQARYGAIPRFFYEGAGWGKEPLFVVTGKDAVEVTGIAIEIAKRFKPSVS